MFFRAETQAGNADIAYLESEDITRKCLFAYSDTDTPLDGVILIRDKINHSRSTVTSSALSLAELCTESPANCTGYQIYCTTAHRAGNKIFTVVVHLNIPAVRDAHHVTFWQMRFGVLLIAPALVSSYAQQCCATAIKNTCLNIKHF
eukprot:6199881-Pleurochrysis_carterae.AAC.1